MGMNKNRKPGRPPYKHPKIRIELRLQANVVGKARNLAVMEGFDSVQDWIEVFVTRKVMKTKVLG